MHIGSEIAERGHDYYLQNKVRYLCIDGTRGCAIVKGTKAYVVEFTYEDGKTGIWSVIASAAIPVSMSLLSCCS